MADGVKQALRDFALLSCQTTVVYFCLDGEQGLGKGCLQLGMDERAEGGYADLSGLLEPHVAIDACTLVEPALLERGIGTDADEVVATIINIRCDVVNLCDIAAGFRTHVETVEPHLGVAEDAVEAQLEVLAEVLLADGEDLAIPAHAGGRILPADGLIAVGVACLTGIGQGRHPVVGYLHLLPGGIVKLAGVGSFVVDGVGLRQVVEILCAAAEVLLGISSVAKGKLPALVEADGLALGLRTQGDGKQAGDERHKHCF